MCHALLNTCIVNPNIDALGPYLGFQSTEVISHTLAKTTQMSKAIYRYPFDATLNAAFLKLIGYASKKGSKKEYNFCIKVSENA